tara:strand:+ start:1259 stop:1486 length:228 start_codon:yes stop_codon:yes gene_type:complete
LYSLSGQDDSDTPYINKCHIETIENMTAKYKYINEESKVEPKNYLEIKNLTRKVQGRQLSTQKILKNIGQQEHFI